MKIYYNKMCVLLVAAVLGTLSVPSAFAQSEKSFWEKVKEALKGGLPFGEMFVQADRLSTVAKEYKTLSKANSECCKICCKECDTAEKYNQTLEALQKQIMKARADGINASNSIKQIGHAAGAIGFDISGFLDVSKKLTPLLAGLTAANNLAAEYGDTGIDGREGELLLDVTGEAIVNAAKKYVEEEGLGILGDAVDVASFAKNLNKLKATVAKYDAAYAKTSRSVSEAEKLLAQLQNMPKCPCHCGILPALPPPNKRPNKPGGGTTGGGTGGGSLNRPPRVGVVNMKI